MHLLAAMVAKITELEETSAASEEQKTADKNALRAMQEIMESLTEQKLQMTVQSQKLEERFSASESRNAELAIENESLKRQLKRSSDENDDLIAELNNWEGKYVTATKTIEGQEQDKVHMQAKMKAYKGKIIEIVAKFKKLRASHRATLEVVKEYSNTIPSWQEELRKVTEIINRNHHKVKPEDPSAENDQLDRVAELTRTVEDLTRQLEMNRKVMTQVEAEKLSVIDEKAQIEGKFKDLENKLLARKQENSDLLQEMKEVNEIMKDRGETISKQQSELSQSKQVCDGLREDLQKIQSILTDRDQTICALIEENKTKEKADDGASTVSKMDDSMTSAEFSEEKYSKLKAMAVKLKKRLEEEAKRVKDLEGSLVVAEGSATRAKELEKSLSESLEREKVTKQEGDKYKGFAKKYNMLALEMESYEKSMEAQTEKLEQKQRIIKELEQTIEEQQGTISSIKEQVRIVEERSTSEVSHSQGLHNEMEKLTARVRELEQLKVENEDKISEHVKEALELKSKLTEVTSALDTVKREQESHQETVNLERDKIKSTCSDLDVQLRNVSKRLAEKTEELERVSKEYSGYKLRAQNILQQNQSQVNSREKELEEELYTVKRLMTFTEQNVNASQDRIKELEKAHQSMADEKETSANKLAEVLVKLEGMKMANNQLQLDSKQHLEEQQNSVKSHRLNVDTLTNVFKTQIEELERKLREQEKMVQDLSNSNRMQGAKLESIAKRSSTDEEKIVELRLNLERSQYGHEDNSSSVLRGISNTYQQPRVVRKVSSTTGLMPLEDLLNSNLDEADYGESSGSHTTSVEVEMKLQAKENQVKHLSALLTEAEQDVAKLNQQNDLLKEEIRRQERSEERDAHINNSEYLKNVIFKVGSFVLLLARV